MAKTQYTRNLPNDEFLAIINANNPSASNPFVTVSDLLSTTNITTVQNYSALPDPTTVTGKFYYCVESEGTRWKLFQLLGGAWKPNGLYYSDGVSWTTTPIPFQATQLEVDAGTNNDRFVTPETLFNYSKWQDYSLNRKNTFVIADYTILNTDRNIIVTSPCTITVSTLATITHFEDIDVINESNGIVYVNSVELMSEYNSIGLYPKDVLTIQKSNLKYLIK